MARDLAPIAKRSRREKTPLHPKAEKILVKRNYPPGEHGNLAFRSKSSRYAIQLREKQKVKRTYGLLEKQFARLVAEATRGGGVAGETLLQLLERRLDNAVYRLGFAPSRRASRQMVTHGHFAVNGKRVDIPSLRLSVGDTFSVMPSSAKLVLFQSVSEQLAQTKALSWLSLDAKKMAAKVTGLPQREDSDQNITEQLIIEFYSR